MIPMKKNNYTVEELIELFKEIEKKDTWNFSMYKKDIEQLGLIYERIDWKNDRTRKDELYFPCKDGNVVAKIDYHPRFEYALTTYFRFNEYELENLAKKQNELEKQLRQVNSVIRLESVRGLLATLKVKDFE
jgi:hypothetical protein